MKKFILRDLTNILGESRLSHRMRLISQEELGGKRT
jgi:hypothetical protein